MRAPLRLGLIGCGRIAELGYAPAIEGCDSVTLAAVADPFEPRRAALADATGAEPFETAAELVGKAGVEAVVVASPVAEHLAHARLAAAAGLPCLVEKPPAADAPGAAELATLDPAPWIGFNRRFQQGIELAPRIPDEGPLELELELCYRRASWRAHEVRDDPLLDLAPHLVDLALLFGGAPAVVRAAAAGPERSVLVLETARGTAWIRCATDRPHLERAVVRRPGGGRLAKSSTGGVVTATLGRLRGGPHPLVRSLRRQLTALAAGVRGQDAGLLATADQGARVMALIDEARALAAASGPATAVAR